MDEKQDRVGPKSNCSAPKNLGPSAPRTAPGFDANAAADLYAHTGARDLDEARAILRARIATGSRVQRSRLWRVLTRLIGLLSNRDPGRQNCNNNRKDDFFHELFYRVARTFPTDWSATRSLLAGGDAPIFDPHLAAVDNAKRRVHHALGLALPIEDLMTSYIVGLRDKTRSKVLTIEAEDALIAALKAKQANPEAIITYVRKSNRRGDRRHPHQGLSDRN
jgi:hypothetical protein